VDFQPTSLDYEFLLCYGRHFPMSLLQVTDHQAKISSPPGLKPSLLVTTSRPRHRPNAMSDELQRHHAKKDRHRHRKIEVAILAYLDRWLSALSPSTTNESSLRNSPPGIFGTRARRHHGPSQQQRWRPPGEHCFSARVITLVSHRGATRELSGVQIVTSSMDKR
jgi:hypothetical protein